MVFSYIYFKYVYRAKHIFSGWTYLEWKWNGRKKFKVFERSRHIAQREERRITGYVRVYRASHSGGSGIKNSICCDKGEREP